MRALGGALADEGRDIALAPDGSYYVTGAVGGQPDCESFDQPIIAAEDLFLDHHR